MTHVLTVETRKLSDPVILIILMKATDRPNHESYTRFQVIEEGFQMAHTEAVRQCGAKAIRRRGWCSSSRVSSEPDDPAPLVT